MSGWLAGEMTAGCDRLGLRWRYGENGLRGTAMLWIGGGCAGDGIYPGKNCHVSRNTCLESLVKACSGRVRLWFSISCREPISCAFIWWPFVAELEGLLVYIRRKRFLVSGGLLL